MFNLLQQLFFKKWADKDNSISKFLEYFKKEWIDSNNCNWYVGAALNIPSTDNGLESNNGVPDQFKKIEIITKKKRGRKAKAKKALEHQM